MFCSLLYPWDAVQYSAHSSPPQMPLNAEGMNEGMRKRIKRALYAILPSWAGDVPSQLWKS